MRKVIWKPIGITLAACGIIASVALVHMEAHPLPTALAAHADDEIFTTIDRPGADFTLLWGINTQGEIVGTAGKGAAFHGGSGFLRRTDGSFVTIDAVIPGVPVKMTSARAINPVGDIVGFYKDTANFNHGFLRGMDGSFTIIDFPGAVFRPFEDESGVLAETGALAINTQGQIIGNYLGMDGATITTHGFLLRHGKYVSIDYPGAVLTFVRGINSDGDILGRYDILDVGTNKVKTHSFLLRHGKFTSIDFPAAVRTFARGINSDGDIVGRYDIHDVATNKVKVLGFVLRHGTFTSIDFPANGINSAGEIVGTYTGADGKEHGYLMSGAVLKK